MIASNDAKGRNSDSKVVFAADLGGTNLRAAVIDCSGRILHRLKQDTPGDSEDPQEIVDLLAVAGHACAAHSERERYSMRAASVVVPGTVDAENAVVVQAPNVPALDGVPLKAELERELGWPVLLENDANAAAVGEMWMGAARGSHTIVCVTLGTGVGGGIILDGRLWRGPDGSAGEIGHTTVDPVNGPRCKCGNTGCLEMFASATAIVRMAREALTGDTDSGLRDERLTAEKVYEAGIKADELALGVMKRMGTYLGIGLANLVNLLNPETIVVGGGAANGWSLFEKYMHHEVDTRAFPLPAQRVRIVRAECGDDAGLLGAARLAFLKDEQAG